MKRFFLSVFLMCLSQVGFAFDFSPADALFANRTQSLDVAEQARAAYKAALATSLTNEEKIYAVEQFSRLSFYEALLFDEDNEKIKKVAMECYENTRAIENRSGKSPIQYYYWKGACLAGWARANGVLASLARAQELKDLIEQGLTLGDLSYEGGGIFRLAAALYMRLPEFNPLGGPTGDLDLALQYATKSLNSPAYAGAQYPETSTGDYFYQIYEVRGEILWRLRRNAEAAKTLEDAIQRVKNGDVAPDRVAESTYEVRDCGKLLAKIQQ